MTFLPGKRKIKLQLKPSDRQKANVRNQHKEVSCAAGSAKRLWGSSLGVGKGVSLLGGANVKSNLLTFIVMLGS